MTGSRGLPQKCQITFNETREKKVNEGTSLEPGPGVPLLWLTAGSAPILIELT
jgi:hypothetical protein